MSGPEAPNWIRLSTAAPDGEETVVTCLVPGKKAEEAAVVAEPEVIGRKAAEEAGTAAEKA